LREHLLGNWKELPAGRANTIGVWIATGPDNPSPEMQETVIADVLADHEIRVVVVESVSINVMYLGPHWK
jgi:hypothetical protein